MNKTAIKNYAIWARVQLIEAAKQRAYEYEITENGENKPGLDMVGGRLLTKTEKEQRNQLISEINRKGFSQVMEEVAYTWFNRFIALRFMEVNGYLPSKIRVFTDENGAFKPEILKQAMSVELKGLDRSKVLDLLDRQDNEELYKYLLITQCNALNAGLPYMFEKIGGWTELLFPANLLRQDSVLGQMISEIPEDDWTDAVQIIGWLYQYYNSELKDETFALLKKNVKITKERIPAATQLFTPDWIVRYMVENSLGRLWYEGHPDFDKSQWRYYQDETEQEPEVEAQLKKIRAEYAQIKPEDIKVIDPCMGSGHILVYAFDVLMQIYTSAGWAERDAAKSILENNLYGLDIDNRAGQLACFAVMMKARKHSRRILNGEVKPNVLSIQDSNWMTDEFIAYVAGKDMTMKADLIMLRKTFKDAKEYGSILNVPTMQYDALYERIDIINRSFAKDLFQTNYRLIATEQLLPLVKQSQIMSHKYDVVVTNPPYMGYSGFNAKMIEFAKKHYPGSKSDLSTIFMEKTIDMCSDWGYMAMINIPVWMFITSYEQLRKKFCSSFSFITMVHPGRGIFGSDFGSVSFIISNQLIRNYRATYLRLFDEPVEVKSPEIREQQFLDNKGKHIAQQERFSSIPGSPIAYWVSDSVYNAFTEFNSLGEIANTKTGMTTGDNDRFLKLWFEINNKDIGHTFQFYSKGSDFRRWYCSVSSVIVWENDGAAVKSFKGSTIRNEDSYFKKCIVWNLITSGSFSARAVFRHKCVMGDASPAVHTKEADYKYILAVLNTKPIQMFLDIINPTINCSSGVLSLIPIAECSSETRGRVNQVSEQCINISIDDWDSFETSWDFKKHPLI